MYVHVNSKLSASYTIYLSYIYIFTYIQVYSKLSASLTVTNLDHRPARVWWLDGHTARPFGTIGPNGGVFTHSSFVSHSW